MALICSGLCNELVRLAYNLRTQSKTLLRLATCPVCHVRIALGSEKFSDGYFELSFGEFHK
jgi:hypothetical protein